MRYFSFLFLTLLFGCKAFKPIQFPEKVIIPSNFFTGTDTSSLGYLEKQNFFKDTVLINLINVSLSSNFDLQRATQRIELAKAQLRLSKGALLPSLNLVGSASVDKFGDYTMNGVGNDDTNLSNNVSSNKKIPDPTPDYFLGLRTSWELNLWNRLRNLKRGAYARFLSSVEGRNLVVTALVAEVASFYYNLLALDTELETIRKNIKLQQTATDMIKVLKQGARANELAVSQFEAQLLDTKALELIKIQQIIRAENALNLLLGRFPQPIPRGKAIQIQSFPDSVVPGIPAKMLFRRPDIRQAELELLAASYDVKVARAAYLPALYINAYSAYNSFRPSVLFDPSSLVYGAFVGLAAPIFNKNIISSNYRRSVADNKSTFLAYQKTIVNGFQEVVTSLKSIDNYRNVYELKQQEVEALRRAVEASNELFFTGYASYLEVITARKSVLQAELEMTDSKKEQFLSLIELYRALGGGWQ